MRVPLVAVLLWWPLSLYGGENLLLGDPLGFSIQVDSIFSGYSAAPLGDGIVYSIQDDREDHPLGKLGDAGNAWHSADSSEAHWIELVFHRARPLRQLEVWWGPERLWPRAFRLEAFDGTEWRTLPGGEDWRATTGQATRFLLRGLAAPRLRIVQRAGGGGAARPTAMCAVEVAVEYGDGAPAARCLAGRVERPALSPALSDDRLLTTAPLPLRDGRPRCLQFHLPQAQPIRQVVFDFLVYDHDDFAPQGDTTFCIETPAGWRQLSIMHSENWSEATTLGPAQRMGRVRWIYHLSGEPTTGARLVFSQGRESAVVATGMAAFLDTPCAASPRRQGETQPPGEGANLLAVTPCRMLLQRGQRMASDGAWVEVPVQARPQRLSLRLSSPKMISMLQVSTTGETPFDCTPELWLEGARLRVPRLTLERADAVREWSLSPVAVDRIDYVFTGVGRVSRPGMSGRNSPPTPAEAMSSGSVRIGGFFAGMHDDGRWALKAIEDSPRDLWAERILALGEPNYIDSAATMLPRRDHRTVIGTPDDGDETAITWNGTHYLRHQDDPRAAQVSRFFAFRLDGEDFGADYERISGGWTDGGEALRPGALPERWIQYASDGVVCTLRSFTGITEGGQPTHRLEVELTLENRTQGKKNGALEVCTGLVNWGKRARLGILNQLPLPDRPTTPDGRLLLDEYGRPILFSDTPFRLGGTEEEPACRFEYALPARAARRIHFSAVADAPLADATLTALPRVDRERAAFARFWRARLHPGPRFIIPEARLAGMAEKFLTDCLVTPDHGQPLYGSYFYEDTFGVEEGWPALALARWGFFADAQSQVEWLLAQAAGDSRSVHKQYRKGLGPTYAFAVYELCRDASYLARILPAMRACADETVSECSKTLLRFEGKPVGYYGLLPKYMYGGDVGEPAYSFYANACAWRGLRDTGLACRAAGEEAAARRYLTAADSYRGHILAAVDRVMDTSSQPPFLPFSLGFQSPHPAEPFPAGDPTPNVLARDERACYWGLFAGLILETRLFPPHSQYVQSILDTMQQSGGLWDGQARFALYASDWDAHYGYGLHQMWFERDQRDKFLLAFYGFIANNLSRDTWVQSEVTTVFPVRTANFAGAAVAQRKIWRQRSHIQLEPNTEPIGSGAGIILCELRDLLVCEGRDGGGALDGSLHLLRNAPVAWLESDQELGVQDAPTAYGRLSYRLRPDLDKGLIKLDLNLESPTPAAVRVHLPPPPGKAWEAAAWNRAEPTGQGPDWCEGRVAGRASLEWRAVSAGAHR